MSKENNIKEKFKLALISTAKAIAEEYNHKSDEKNKNTKNIDFIELENLNNRNANKYSIITSSQNNKVTACPKCSSTTI